MFGYMTVTNCLSDKSTNYQLIAVIIWSIKAAFTLLAHIYPSDHRILAWEGQLRARKKGEKNPA